MDYQKAQQTHTNFNVTKRKGRTIEVSAFKTANSVSVTLLLLSFYIILLLLLAVPAQAKYTLFTPNPGIHVERIGTGRVRKGSFRIDVVYNYTKLTEDITAISNKVQQMDQLCKDLQHQIGEDSCSSLFLRLAKLEDYIISIKAIVDSYIKQERHNGTFFNTENGNLHIPKLKMDQEETVENSENTFFSAVCVQEDIELSTLHENFQNTLRVATDSLNLNSNAFKIVRKNELQTNLLSSYQTASMYVDQITDYYAKLSKILMQKGNLYDLLSVDRINKIISSANLPPNLTILPDIILETKIRRKGNAIYIYGSFPVIDKSNFTLLEVIPVPLEIKGNSYLTLDIPNEIIAVDYNKQLYFYLTDEDLSKSVRLQGDIYLCTPKIIKKMQDYPICVLDHINNSSRNKTCETKRNDITSIIWKELRTKNAWMFITNKPTKVAVLCNNNRENVHIDKSGIFQIPQNCVIRSKRSILSQRIEDDTPYTQLAYIKDVSADLNKPTPQISSSNLQAAIKEPVKQVFALLRNMNGEVKDFKSQLQNKDTNDKPQGIFGNVVAGVSVVSVILVALVTYRSSEPFWKVLLEYICTNQLSSEPNETTSLLQNS